MSYAAPDIRRATAADGAAVARVHNVVVAEGGLSALDTRVSAESETAWLASFGPRAVMFVAEVKGSIVGFQTLEPFQSFLRSMKHVGTAGTQIATGHRGRGIGRALWNATCTFGRDHGYEKVVIYVRRGNENALGFYRHLGFRDIGIARRQVRIAGAYEDEVFLEAFLSPPPVD